MPVIVRLGFLDVRFIVRRGLVYGLASGVIVALYLFVGKQIDRLSAHFVGEQLPVFETTFLVLSLFLLQPVLAGIKSLNRLDQVLARTEWSDSSIFEGLMLDADDRLICGTMSNVFIGHGNSIATPALARCGVAGVMRRHLLSLFDKERIACEIRDIDVRELESADEIFIANSQFGVLPVRRIDSQRMTVGSVTRKVLQLAATNGIPECRI